MESTLTPEDRIVVVNKLVQEIGYRDNLIEEKRETATGFTKKIKETNGVIHDLCGQLDGSARQPDLPGSHEGE